MPVSPVSWLTDREYLAAPVSERWLAWADARVGQRELPGNRGPFVEELLALVGLGPGHAWCAAFQLDCALRAGVPRGRLPRKAARVAEWAVWASDQGRARREPARVRLCYRVDWRTRLGHIGIVARVGVSGSDRAGQILAVEGNTSEGGVSREGVMVAKKWSPTASWDGFIDLRGLA